jgi:hypothetical protein
MLQARLADDAVASTPRERLASYLDPNRLAVKPEKDAGYRLVLVRSQAFTRGERTLAGHFIDELAKVVALEAAEYEADLLRAIQRRVVARDLAGGAPLVSILERLETWSSETYEGQRIVASIGLDVDPAGTGVALDDLWDEPFQRRICDCGSLVVLRSDLLHVRKRFGCGMAARLTDEKALD